MKKKKVTIEVDPLSAVAVIGFCRMTLPSIIDSFSDNLSDGMEFNKKSLNKMKKALDDIYEGLISATDLRENAKKMMDECGVLEEDNLHSFFEKMTAEGVDEKAKSITIKQL